MALGVSPLLKQLSAASQTLNEASDTLTQEIKEVEQAIGAFNLGVSTWVKFRETPEEHDFGNGNIREFDRVDMLGYDKHHGRWALIVYSGVEELNQEETWLLRDSPRDLRVLAVDAIPELVEKLANEAIALAEKVKSKADRTKAIAHSIRKQKKAEE